ncbi:hypothetical protein C7212DRAFT_163264 [Tuber magnatum]|uniref:LYC1 C-terminal domain-containing protein n=1 Tax=Tuber magnatum TaxID=42249 RepID=A0A317SZX6_9PEZI|nr:hypothetical protein C7212DRAFT_163264 [Tuber magnatum]
MYRHLRNPTPQELIQIRSAHKGYWGTHLTLKQYLNREEVLSSTTLTGNGGLTNWALVDPTTSPATVLASCESIRKEVFVVEAGTNEMRVSHGHGIGSVFTPIEMRGKGHASIMLKMLAEELKWHGGESALSALYSDIGKAFYRRLGWHPHASLHLNIPVSPSSLPTIADKTTPLETSSLPSLCTQDIKALKASLTSTPALKPRISFHPDSKTFDWHFARAEYLARITNRPPPTTKGAITTSGSAWIVWTHDFQKAESKLHILRVAGEPSKEDVKDLLAAALAEAREWGLTCVQTWNPKEAVAEVGKELGGRVVEREADEIPSVMMYESGMGSTVGEVEWFANERFAWC